MIQLEISSPNFKKGKTAISEKKYLKSDGREIPFLSDTDPAAAEIYRIREIGS
jgi:hypothetical protein